MAKHSDSITEASPQAAANEQSDAEAKPATDDSSPRESAKAADDDASKSDASANSTATRKSSQTAGAGTRRSRGRSTRAPRSKAGATKSSAKASHSAEGATASDADNDHNNSNEPAIDPDRQAVAKTYKLYINGAYPRAESGKYHPLHDAAGALIGHVGMASRKDLREAVVAARAAQSKWAGRAAYNRAQIIYRLAEMMESRAAQFAFELERQSAKPASAAATAQAQAEVAAAIDRLVYFAGWADKYSQIFSSVNPVASSHFNFSLPGPVGVVATMTPHPQSLLAMSTLIAAAAVGGNAVIAITPVEAAPVALAFAEAVDTSDFPAGVVNILTGDHAELTEHTGSHRDIDAVIYAGGDRKRFTEIADLGSDNLKRVVDQSRKNWTAAEDPYLILDTQEIKTTWHPIGV